VRASHRFTTDSARFDEDNLVSCAGLVPVLELAQRTRLPEIIAAKVSITTPRIRFGAANPVPKLISVIAGMCAGADSIDEDECLGRRRGGPTTRPAPVAIIPSAGHQAAVPTKQCRGSDSKDLRPAAAGKQARQSGQPDAVRRRVAHPGDLPAQDCVIVPQDQQLGIFGYLTAAENAQRTQ
jgi:hypothetical protein